MIAVVLGYVLVAYIAGAVVFALAVMIGLLELGGPDTDRGFVVVCRRVALLMLLAPISLPWMAFSWFWIVVRPLLGQFISGRFE